MEPPCEGRVGESFLATRLVSQGFQKSGRWQGQGVPGGDVLGGGYMFFSTSIYRLVCMQKHL